MASWLTHLTISTEIARDPIFLLGSLSPDFWTESGFDREHTHYQAMMHSPIEYTRLIDEMHVLDHRDPSLDSFLKGYLCHLITDDIWLRDIYEPFFCSSTWMNSDDANGAKRDEMPRLDSYMAGRMDIQGILSRFDRIEINEIPCWSWVTPMSLSYGLSLIKKHLNEVEAVDSFGLKHIPQISIEKFICDSIDVTRGLLRQTFVK